MALFNGALSTMPSRNVVVVTDRILMPPWSGNRMRIMGIVRCLRAVGCRVALVGPELGKMSLLENDVDATFPVRGPMFAGGNVGHFNVKPYRSVLRKAVAATGTDTVIAEYAWMAPAMAGLPRHVRRCVDCHDLLHERSSRFRAAGVDPWIDCTREQERRLLGYADVLLAIQHRDAAVLREMLPGKRVISVTPFTDLPTDYQPRTSETMTVLAVGGDHAGNEGICQFANGPWSQVLASMPAARLQLVGAIAARLSPRAGVDAVGEVEDLYPYYCSAAVVVCPVIVGTGLKIKMVEALRLGKATVATSAAAEGLPATNNTAWVSADSLSGCAEAIVKLLSDRASRVQLEESAFAYGQRYLSREVALAQLRSLLPGRFRATVRRLLRR